MNDFLSIVCIFFYSKYVSAHYIFTSIYRKKFCLQWTLSLMLGVIYIEMHNTEIPLTKPYDRKDMAWIYVPTRNFVLMSSMLVCLKITKYNQKSKMLFAVTICHCSYFQDKIYCSRKINKLDAHTFSFSFKICPNFYHLLFAISSVIGLHLNFSHNFLVEILSGYCFTMTLRNFFR